MNPVKCRLWKADLKPEDLRLKERFELVTTYFKDDDWWRYLLKCRECGQLYFFEFYEERDWEKGNDPQYSVWIPVASGEEGKEMAHKSKAELRTVVPRIQSDWPADQEKKDVRWIRE
ncbi:hypothetical protein HY572_06465 [Candidatus Micrarchaeota archaeon]|nr:hypothetical protein [Candidatus Micrarchaeota archaeon]